LAERICTAGDALNTCGSKHKPGDTGKLDSPPCISCDFVRRKKSLGLDVALQMWMRAVKSETPIVLGVTSSTAASPKRRAEVAAASTSSAEAKSRKVEAAPAPKTATAAKASPAATNRLATAEALPAKQPAVAKYNPLRPAAAAAAAAAASGSQPASSSSAKAAAKPLPAKLVKPPWGGLQYEEISRGAESGPGAVAGQEVEIRFTVRSAAASALAAKKKGQDKGPVERGEIKCKLGQSEVIDGWVDGNVDMEEVLAFWGRSLVGMRAGAKRRVHIPAGKGFKKRGGEAAGSGTALHFEAELRKLL